ncbi:TIGR03086 family metal-binding protein [Gordonia lacunae]|uniref:TIGR03086 family protein n=1 Tax=Gordonia lacunae TaxID=417102 RepID=A0A2C9ZHZ5_9ACTN|nr:TIGR03086 family metal-binding protein [Gordonia lacunae]OUC76028.1 TIGR03086 family protein [Gordonia lacunae]
MPADPRPAFRVATAWVTGLLAEIRDDQLRAPTPCDEFDVRTLSAHVVATAQRARALADGADVRAMPTIAEQHDAATYAALVEAALEGWADDATLGRMVQVPWGEVPGAGALWGYVSETLVHGWDLAVATGQPAEADPETAEATLAVAKQFIPAGIRTDPIVPFGVVVEPRPDAGPTERLANWTGRRSEGWSPAP